MNNIKKATQTQGLKKRLRKAGKEERQELLDGLPHEVGFGKPPKSGQFKPGESGNKKGRAHGARSLRTILAEEFSQAVEVQEGGRRRKLPKQQVAIRQFVNQAAGGNLRAFVALVDMARKTGLLDDVAAPREQVLTSADIQTAERLLGFYDAQKSAAPALAKKEDGGRDD